MVEADIGPIPALGPLLRRSPSARTRTYTGPMAVSRSAGIYGAGEAREALVVRPTRNIRASAGVQRHGGAQTEAHPTRPPRLLSPGAPLRTGFGPPALAGAPARR